MATSTIKMDVIHNQLLKSDTSGVVSFQGKTNRIYSIFTAREWYSVLIANDFQYHRVTKIGGEESGVVVAVNGSTGMINISNVRSETNIYVVDYPLD